MRRRESDFPFGTPLPRGDDLLQKVRDESLRENPEVICYYPEFGDWLGVNCPRCLSGDTEGVPHRDAETMRMLKNEIRSRPIAVDSWPAVKRELLRERRSRT